MRTIVVGAGYWGINYVRELVGNLVGVVEPDQDRAKYVADMYGTDVYQDLDRALMLGFEAAIVTTPPDCHTGIATKLLEAGKYVLIEKPLSMSVEDAYRLATYKDRIMAGLVYQYHPQVEWLRGKFGERKFSHGVSRRTNAGPMRTWHNALWDLAPHDISIFNYITGSEPIGYAAIGDDDWSSLWMEYPGGFQTITYVSWLGSPKVRTVELVAGPEAFDEERIIFDDMKFVYEASPLRRMLDDFLTLSWRDCGRCTFEQGLEVVKVLERVSQ